MEVIWSKNATKHLESILEYVEYEFGENTAAKTLSKISDKVKRLSSYPTSGIKDANYSTSLYTVRHVTIAPNIIYYITFSTSPVLSC